MSKQDCWPLVRVEWKDAMTDSGWVKESELPVPSIIVSVGYLVLNNDHWLTLAASVSVDREVGLNNTIAIPKVWVEDIKEIPKETACQTK